MFPFGQTFIHLHLPEVGKMRIACSVPGNLFNIMDVIQEYPHGHSMTGDPRAVTCPMCKKTEAFTKLMSKFPS